MPPDLSHLLDPDPNAVPELPVPPAQPERPLSAEGAGGIRVSQSEDGLVISSEDEGGLPAVSNEVTFDPLAYMSFRAKLVRSGSDFSVVTAISYLNYVFYESAWFFDQFQIPSETINAGTLAQAQYLYAKIPVVFYSGGDGMSSNNPSHTFVSEQQEINSGFYTFTQVTSTGYITRDRAAAPASYFLLTPTPNPPNTITIPPGSTSGTGEWHFLIATVSQTGLQQIHLGALTLPQPMTFQFTDLTVT